MPSVILIADKPCWAYDILAQILKEQLSNWSVAIEYVVNIRKDVTAFDFSDYDVVFFFLWYDAMIYGPNIKGFTFEKTCVGVHSLASWKKRGITINEASFICNQFGAVGVISKQIKHLLNLDRVYLTPCGVDKNLFVQKPFPHFEKLRFMWVGDPNRFHHGDNKGFSNIILPVVESIGDVIEFNTATPENPVPHNKMGEFYASGHVLLCMSKHEGVPIPVIEAMFSGRPVISTCVGVVPEIVVPDVSGWIIERNFSALKTQILNLVNNPNLLLPMGNAAYLAARGRSSIEMAESYDSMFQSILRG